MSLESTLIGLLLPLAGTVLGASCVFFLKNGINPPIRKLVVGFAAGIMVAASVWSLLIPAIEMTGGTGITKALPAAAGFLAGILFLLVLDIITPHQHTDGKGEGPQSRLNGTSKLFLAITLHNIPEGMAVGVSIAAALEGNGYMTMAAAIALSIGIAIQNFPEGAIVSMPMLTLGNSRRKSFLLGSLSGAVEPVAAVITILLTSFILSVLPYLLAFAAGAMLYVVVEELIPETQQGTHSNLGTLGFALGFALMMILDVVL